MDMMSSPLTAPQPRWAILFDKDPTSHRLDGHLFVDMLGRGGNSSGVMLVRHVQTGELYARKYILPDDDQKPNMWVTEFELGSDLNNSGFTPAVRSGSPANDGVQMRTLVTEYCDGGSLQDWFKNCPTSQISKEYMA